jgi:hypothetical protein
MPCDGPSQEYAYIEGEKAFLQVMGLLKNQYGVSLPLIDLGWEKAQEKLKEAVQEMIWCQHASDF